MIATLGVTASYISPVSSGSFFYHELSVEDQRYLEDVFFFLKSLLFKEWINQMQKHVRICIGIGCDDAMEKHID